MIDHIRERRLGSNLRPADRHLASQVVVGTPAKKNEKSSFKPPREVAASDEQQATTSTGGHLVPEKPPGKKGFGAWLKSRTKKQWIIFGIIAGLVLLGGGAGAYFALKEDPAPVAVKPAPTPKKEAPKATTVPSTLTGRQVDPSINELPVTAVMIENSLDARPQAGLYDAGVVFEAIAEGGITRFLALFQDTSPDYVGPVRSVRPYYIQWAMGFDAAIAHAGGSAEALANMTQWRAKDLNHHSAYFWRVSNRTAPHNLYTSIAKLHEYEAAKGYGKSVYTGFARKAEKASPTVNARSINLNVSSSNYNVHYDYDPTKNSYARSEGGQAHTDDKSGATITPKVVVALVVPRSNKGIYSVYSTIGSGTAYVFQDGTVTKGTWHKAGIPNPLTFTGENGAPLALNPGQTWITVVGEAERVSYSP